MKKILFLSAITLFFLIGCKSSEQTVVQNQNILEQIDSKGYSIDVTTALPSGYKSIPLSYGYSLKVSNDTIESFLPYFGRAYSAPINSDDNGIMFTSTSFEYSVSAKKNSRSIIIKTKDTRRPITIYLDIQKSGSTSLRVSDPNRQQISFYGNVEQ